MSDGRSLLNTRFSCTQPATLLKQAVKSHTKTIGCPCTCADRWLAGRGICSDFRQGRGWLERMPFRIWDYFWSPSIFCTVEWSPPSNFLGMSFLLLLNLLTYKGRLLGGKKREENTYNFFFLQSFFFSRAVKRIGKNKWQRNQRKQGEKKKKKQDPQIETLFKLCPTTFSFLLCNITYFATYGKFRRTASYLDVRSTVITQHMIAVTADTSFPPSSKNREK